MEVDVVNTVGDDLIQYDTGTKYKIVVLVQTRNALQLLLVLDKLVVEGQ